MGQQLRLPAGWANGFGMLSRRDPGEDLDRLKRDVVDAKAAIRIILDGVAERHGVPVVEVNRAMGLVDDLLSDLAYDVESALTDEIEDLDRIC